MFDQNDGHRLYSPDGERSSPGVPPEGLSAQAWSMKECVGWCSVRLSTYCLDVDLVYFGTGGWVTLRVLDILVLVLVVRH
jgi:hypothetical protein